MIILANVFTLHCLLYGLDPCLVDVPLELLVGEVGLGAVGAHEPLREQLLVRRLQVVLEVLVDREPLFALEALDGRIGGVELLGADKVVDDEAHQALLGLCVLVAAVAEELLGLLVEERAVDGLVGDLLVLRGEVGHQLPLRQEQLEADVAHTEQTQTQNKNNKIFLLFANTGE